MRNFILGAILMLGIVGLILYNYSDDGAKRKFIKKEYQHTELVLTIRVFKNERELRKAIEHLVPKKQKKNDILGFSKWYKPHDGTCTIYITEAHRESDFETWGHELAHCMYGNWHK